uniref:probable WRKY transcription factor 41 n=1 Tax=Erigeron canadensis TaxID=72917 RepID=UPI001CB9D633|nr:probable WRKY transcription factor 41 [Erigeron canadensis]
MDHKRVIDELIKGKEFAKQLRIHLNNSTSSSYEVQELLIHNILNSYEKSLSLLATHGVHLYRSTSHESYLHFEKRVKKMESQAPSSQSPHSEFSDLDQFKVPSHQIFSSKKKSSSDESMQKLKNIQVKVNGDKGFQEALDDGYSWSKYGQKDILGAKHPRGYYRCTSRQTQGCLATKQIQRVDDATIIYDITYHGNHTCKPSSSTPQLEIQNQPSQQKQVLKSLDIISTFKTENLECPLYNLPLTSTFNLPTSANTISRPTTPKSTYYIMSPHRVGLGQKDENPVALETELNHIVSAPTSFKSSLDDDSGYTFGDPGFGNDINFDDPTFF